MALLGRHAPLPVTYAGGARTLVRCAAPPWSSMLLHVIAMQTKPS